MRRRERLAARRGRVRRRRRGRPRVRPAAAAFVLAALLLVSVAAALAVADPDVLSGEPARHGQPISRDPEPVSRPAVSARHRAGRAPASAGGRDIYSHTLTGMFAPVTRRARYLVYAPDSSGNGVYVIDPRSYRVIRYIPTGAMVQHVVPAWNLGTLYATNDIGNSLTPINPDTGLRGGGNIPVADPYNMYFTPDGKHAIVVEEGRGTLAFRNPRTFALQKSLPVNCPGIDHMDFSAGGSFALASCEFSAQMVRINLRSETVSRYVHVGGSPQDVKLSPDGRTFYVANRFLPARGVSGVQLIDAHSMKLVGFIPTRLDAHGLYVSRNTRELYVTNRAGGAITVINFATRRSVATWLVPGTPDMGGVSPDGRTLWVSGRYSGAVYAISTRTGHVIASIPVGTSPHGLSVWPQPGRYSTGHTGVMR